MILVIIAVVVVVIVVKNARTWGADFAKQVAVQVVNDSNLPDDQKQRIIVRIDTLTEDFKAEKITLEDLVAVLEAIGDSPLLPLGMVYLAEEKYINPSDLSDEEKADAVLTLQRFARGVFEKSIPQEAVDEITAPIKIVGPDGQEELKETVTTEELKTLIEAARAKADEAGVPNEPFEVNIADEIDKAIDAALGEPSL